MSILTKSGIVKPACLWQQWPEEWQRANRVFSAVIPNQDKRLRGWRCWWGSRWRGSHWGDERDDIQSEGLVLLADSHNRAIIANLPCRPIRSTKLLLKRLISAAAAKVLHTGDSRWSPRHLHFKAPEPTSPDGAGGVENAPTSFCFRSHRCRGSELL